MKTTTINGKVYKIAQSTWHSDHSSLFISFDGGLTFTTEYGCSREFDGIKNNPDNLKAYKELWPR